MEGCSDSKATPNAETLEAVAFHVQRVAHLLRTIRDLVEDDENTSDRIAVPITFAAERGVQILDNCLGALDGTGRPTMGNYLPADDIADRIKFMRKICAADRGE